MTEPMRRALVVVMLLGLGPACRCGGGVDPITVGFHASPATLEFGRVLEGTTATLPATLSSDSRATITVSLTTQAPFSVDASVELPGGSEVQVPVTFKAGAAEASGTLTFTSADASVTLALHGTGVHPPTCTPSGPCLLSTYSLALDRCVETQAPEDASCDPGNLCLELGRCKAGACLGVSRSCDDNDACTLDGCSVDVGCVHTPRGCPAPSNPCHVPTCNPSSGCGEAQAGDGTICGSLDCVTAHLCALGTCLSLDTPDGTLCGSAVACAPEGFCQGKSCVRADAGPWLPAWSASLSGAASDALPGLLSNGAAVFFPMCGLERPAAPDGGVDGGLDGGLDAGDDAGLDAGGGDGGSCGLLAYTLGGFPRFNSPVLFEDGLERRLVHLSPRGVLLLGDGGLEYRSLSSGLVREALALRPAIDAIAFGLDASVLLALPDGTLGTWPVDAGFEPLAALGSDQVIALDLDGTLYAWDGDAGVLSQAVFDADGGLHLTSLTLDAGTRSLTVAGGAVVAGTGSTVRFLADGGATILPLDHGPWAPGWASRATLQTRNRVAMFGRRCPLPAVACAEEEQALWVSMNSLSDGAQTWAFPALPPGAGSQIVEAALVDLLTEVGVAALTRFEVDGGPAAALEVDTPDGGVSLFCRLPAASARVRAGLFVGQAMLVLVQRPDAGFALESYDLKSLPIHGADWGLPETSQGWRRAQ